MKTHVLATAGLSLSRSKRFRMVWEQRKTEERSFRAGKTLKIPFFGLSLLLNPTETIATRAAAALALLPSHGYIYFKTNGPESTLLT